VKLDTLALALFANGDVQTAIDTETEALALLTDATSAYRPERGGTTGAVPGGGVGARDARGGRRGRALSRRALSAACRAR
jgi:hypothetical protein